MNVLNVLARRLPVRRAAWLVLLVCLSLPASPATAARKINYVPGITLAPEVLLPDGQTPRTYQTAQGPTLWSQDLPIQQGDILKLNVFVATGGADLKEIKVRLDNNPVADLKASPWNTRIDTATLSTGYHMVEVWAQATGDPPQSSTKQLLFDVVKTLPGPAQTAVKAGDQVYTGGSISPVTLPDSDLPPILPAPLLGKPTDADARVLVDYVDATQPSGTPARAAGDQPVLVSDPTLFTVQRAPSGDAVRFTYALVRNGVTILSSDTPLSLVSPTERTAIKIQRRTDSLPGLRPGQVSLWVWGVDSQGRPGDPVKVFLQIAP